ncbi:MAG: hypothetical protein COA94_05485 [Rickettsiales bacterium]|nr:MAG: hypothetical protein COA94_05485 [Rickettsiales bacterium]
MFYKLTTTRINIIRVLHEKMDFKTNIQNI